MLVRWEVGVCAVLALCSVGAVPQRPPATTRPRTPPTLAPTTMPPTTTPPTTTPASDCGLPSHRPVALDTYGATWITNTWLQQNNISIELVGHSRAMSANISNDGDTVNVEFPDMDSDDAPHIEWTASGNVIWRMNLTRLSFHWPSEHVIDGRKSFLELHMEHKDDQGLTTVLAYTYDICSPARSGFDVISAAARNITNPGSSVRVSQFVPQSLMPYGIFDRMVMCDYFLYEFSESPSMQECPLSIFWMVYHHPQCVSEEQMDVELLDDKGGSIVHLDEELPLVESVPATYFTCF